MSSALPYQGSELEHQTESRERERENVRRLVIYFNRQHTNMTLNERQSEKGQSKDNIEVEESVNKVERPWLHPYTRDQTSTHKVDSNSYHRDLVLLCQTHCRPEC